MLITSPPEYLLIATRNEGKLGEFRQLLLPLNSELRSLQNYPALDEPEETGETFRENAELKAAYYATQTGHWALADDSGLSIDALGGRPGVHSARFGGRDSSYSEKMQFVLDEMDGIPDLERTARFASVLVLSDPNGVIHIAAEGICEGTISYKPRGTNGFGYDPIFIPADHDRTFGEMTDEEKRLLSHRGRASKQFIRQMLDFTGV